MEKLQLVRGFLLAEPSTAQNITWREPGISPRPCHVSPSVGKHCGSLAGLPDEHLGWSQLCTMAIELKYVVLHRAGTFQMKERLMMSASLPSNSSEMDTHICICVDNMLTYT
jgi:hypothetical protein